MMKIFLLLALLLSLSHAKSKESCYTIQLTSQPNTTKNLQRLEAISYPDACRVMQIGSSLTVRCECYDRYKELKLLLPEYKQNHKKATITTTYKYRFGKTQESKSALRTTKKSSAKESKTAAVNDKPSSAEDEELRLMTQVFLYNGDLRNAYRVATLGYRAHPSSYYWNQKMFEICKWTNRSARSMKHLRNMYNIKRDENMESELIEYGKSTYQYEEIEPLVVNRAKADPTEENIDLMIRVYKKLGYPEKVVKVLDAQYAQDPTNKIILTKSLALSLEMGDLELAQKYVKLLEKDKPYSKKDATLIAKYYYISHDIPYGYASLFFIKENQYDTEEDVKKYYEIKSDLGWYLQKNREAAEASKYLLEHNASRLVDYERVAFVYQKDDPKLAARATREAYSEYKHSYLFYSYANSALNLKQFDALQEMLDGIDEQHSPLAHESLYWLIKSKVYAHYESFEEEKIALSKAYALEPNNMQIKLELLWFYMDQDAMMKVKMILNDMAENPKLKSSLYLPMASAYYNMNDINRASYYVQKLRELNDPTTKLLEFELLEAYIYQAEQNEIGFKSKMHSVEQRLKAKAKANPRLKKSDRFLSSYLRVAMYVLNPDKFEKRLKKAKPYLSSRNYNEIAYSWAIQNSAYEKSLKIYHRMHHKELWLVFSNALVFQQHTIIEDILEQHLYSVAINDASNAAYKDGQIALAQEMSYRSIEQNQKSLSGYIQHLSLVRERSDEFHAKTAYTYREPLLQKYLALNNSTYLQDGYSLKSRLFYADNSTTDKKLYNEVADNALEIGVGLKRRYNRGELTVETHYHDAMSSYMEYALSGKYRASTDIRVGAKVGKNMNTNESTQLLLGGKKDGAAVDLSWMILNATTIDFHAEYNKYNSQDDVNLGTGRYSRVLVARQFRSGYPDIRVGIFYDRGLYDETSGSRGVIDLLTPNPTNVLPANFYNIGVNLSYGMMNSNLYTRVWRPYIEFSPYYNSDLDDYTYGFNAGIGGKVFHQDHLAIGASYTDSVNGIGGRILELYLNYQFLYYHP